MPGRVLSVRVGAGGPSRGPALVTSEWAVPPHASFRMTGHLTSEDDPCRSCGELQVPAQARIRLPGVITAVDVQMRPSDATGGGFATCGRAEAEPINGQQ